MKHFTSFFCHYLKLIKQTNNVALQHYSLLSVTKVPQRWTKAKQKSASCHKVCFLTAAFWQKIRCPEHNYCCNCPHFHSNTLPHSNIRFSQWKVKGFARDGCSVSLLLALRVSQPLKASLRSISKNNIPIPLQKASIPKIRINVSWMSVSSLRWKTEGEGRAEGFVTHALWDIFPSLTLFKLLFFL